MELTDAKAYLAVIRAEEQRRAALLPDDPDAGYDRWIFSDAPFIGELCIVFLVALRHHVERRLILFAACAADGGQQIDRQQFLDRMKDLSALQNAKWHEVDKRLSPSQCAHSHAIVTLRHLANAYKHEPNLAPDQRLLKHLGLDLNVRYAPMPESEALQKGLASIVGLAANASYSDIASSFVDCVEGFLNDVKARNAISPVKWGRASMRDVAH